MHRLFLALLPLLAAPAALASTEKNCGCACCADKPKDAVCCCYAPEATAANDKVKRHPLRGVITRVDVENAQLMVKHEEIPGVMRAMTMLFKVDAATARAVQKGQTITAQMSRVGNDWRLEDVKAVDARK